MISTVKIHMLSESVSPITHMGGTSGNEAILNRERVLHNGEIVDVPFLSGNALRHKMIRDPGARYLVDACALKGTLNIDQANFMFTGGSLSQSSTTDNLKMIATMQEVSPLFRMLGGSLRDQIIGGSLMVSRGILVCEENLLTISKQCSALADTATASAHPAQSFIGKTQYTRGEATRMKEAPDMLKGDVPPQKTNLMIYGGECVIPGSMWYHNLMLNNVCDLEIGAALHCLNLWQASGGVVGGSSRIGHGRLRSTIHIESENPVDASTLVLSYIEHVNSHTEELVSWLNEAFS